MQKKHRLVAFVHTQTGDVPTSQVCSLTGNQTHDLSVMGTMLQPLSHHCKYSGSLNNIISFNVILLYCWGGKYNNSQLSLCGVCTFSRVWDVCRDSGFLPRPTDVHAGFTACPKAPVWVWVCVCMSGPGRKDILSNTGPTLHPGRPGQALAVWGQEPESVG